jgi:hypothetical protein
MVIIIFWLLLFIIIVCNVSFFEVEKIDTNDTNDTKNIKINVLFLVRDGEKYLLNNLNKIESFCNHNFGDYKIFFLENDSTDSTRQILSDKMSTNTKIKGTFNKLKDVHSSKLCGKNNNINCNKRTRFLSLLRQEVLEYSLKEPSDITMMCDLDFVSFDETELLNMIRILINKDLDGIFGMSYTNETPYDTGAISPYDQTLIEKIVSSNNNSIIKVDSAFSGFGVYFTRSIISKKAKYNFNTNSIEHIDFNRHFDKLYVYPKFKPKY